MSDDQKPVSPSPEQVEEFERLSEEKTEELRGYVNELITLHSNSLVRSLSEIADRTGQKLSFCLMLFTNKDGKKDLINPNSRGHRLLTSDVDEQELAAVLEEERERLTQAANYMKHVLRITHPDVSRLVH